MEAIASFIPYAGALVVILMILNVTHTGHIFHWMDPELTTPGDKNFDTILFEKKKFLNIPFYVFRTLFYVIGASFFVWKLKSLSKKVDETTSALKRQKKEQDTLKKVSEQAAENAAGEISLLDRLYKKATDVNSSMKDRIAAVKQLKTEFPDYFGLGIGMSLSSPFDTYNKEIGEKISEGRARNQHKSIYSTFTMNKSLFTKPTVEAILKIKIDFIADNLHLFTKSKHVILK